MLLYSNGTDNDILWRAFIKAGIPAIKEPSGLSRIDGKRPDGLTLIPWCGGKQLAWDVTIVNSLAVSYIDNVSLSAGGVAEMAAENKIAKYANLASSVLFQPVALEILGPFNASAIDFLSDLDHLLELSSGDKRERQFLFQRLSVAVQRFNAIAFTGSFVIVADADQ